MWSTVVSRASPSWMRVQSGRSVNAITVERQAIRGRNAQTTSVSCQLLKSMRISTAARSNNT